MTVTTEFDSAAEGSSAASPLLQLHGIGKMYGNIVALHDVSFDVAAGTVTCILGDNGAGKSTLIKIVAGLHRADSGTYEVLGDTVHFDSPREALDRGIATVYQDLAVVPLMPVWRNFFLGSEKSRGWGPARHLDVAGMKRTAKEELSRMGIDLRDVNQPIGTLSGGERQCVAIARAIYFGARVVILDEPTAALGVKQSGVVLRYILQAKSAGIGVIFITHNPHHAYPVGDKFLLLKRGRSIGYFDKPDISIEELTSKMAGEAELVELLHELQEVGGVDTSVIRSIRSELDDMPDE